MATAPDYWTDTLSRMLLKLEADVHRDGWDQDPALCAILERRPGALSLLPLPIRIENPAGEFLAFVGQRFTDGSDWSAGITTVTAANPDWRGFAFLHEGWMGFVQPSERQGRRLADIPGSKEVRSILTTDVWGHIGRVTRVRGEKPTVEVNDNKLSDADDSTVLNGRVVEALIAMVKAVASKLPDDRCDLTKLLSLHAPSEEEVEKWVEENKARKAAD